jgi:hypothetical protein
MRREYIFVVELTAGGAGPLVGITQAHSVFC